MMVYALLFIAVLLLPLPADAAYKIYLKNGSVISGVSSYEKRNGEVMIYFGGGSMGVSEKDILKIEESGAAERDFRTPAVSGTPEAAPPPAAPPPADDTAKMTRKSTLQSELDTVNSEIKKVEEEEAQLAKAINDRKTSRLTYNALQLKQLQSDIAPMEQELANLQVKKGALYQRRTTIESELQSLQ